MATEELLVAYTDDGIARITVNRPERRNAIHARLLRELGERVESVSQHATVRAIIITGASDQAFIAGADLSELQHLDHAGARSLAESAHEALRKIEHCPKPVLAAIHGYALGAGLEVALACHFRIAAKEAKLGLPEGRLGLIPGYGGTQRLTHLVGTGHALAMMLTAEPLTADRALAMGLVTQVVPSPDLLELSEEFLRKTFVVAPLAQAAMIKAVLTARDTGLADGLAHEAEAFAAIRRTRDAQEGIDAFLSKRVPVFEGR